MRLPGRRAPRRSCAGEVVDDPETIATAIRIGNPASWEQALAARDESGGVIDAVTDEQILDAHRWLATREVGIFVEPASAASVAGLLQQHGRGQLDPGQRVVCTVTGHGLKDPQWALERRAHARRRRRRRHRGCARARPAGVSAVAPVLRTGPVRVTVPATSANLGPGFDAFGLALSMRDALTACLRDERGVVVTVHGEGEGRLPTDGLHLVAVAMRTTFDRLGVRPAGFVLETTNVIPHGRGLGSSAAAIVAGVLLARGLVEDGDAVIDDAGALDVAARLEGHPDNVAAALLGGFTTAWTDGEGHSRAVSRAVHPGIVPVVCVPAVEVATRAARALLPDSVPHADAAFNAGRAGLLVTALTERPDLLMDATEDRLHQRYRSEAMPESLSLVAALRRAGIPAVVSGAGPTVLALAGASTVDHVPGLAPGFAVQRLAVDPRGAEASGG